MTDLYVEQSSLLDEWDSSSSISVRGLVQRVFSLTLTKQQQVNLTFMGCYKHILVDALMDRRSQFQMTSDACGQRQKIFSKHNKRVLSNAKNIKMTSSESAAFSVSEV